MGLGGERKIPVFTVMKNGAVLKNIFIVNSPDSLSPERHVGRGDEHEVEEILVVGRHPDCNIMLTHPSISRFHLQIRSIPSRQKLSVTDLCSVHGTWISDQKIEAGTSVDVKEGDAIRIGGSTRIYRLHWIPLRQAYDMENPFVTPLDICAPKEQEEDEGVFNSENVKDGKLVPGEDKTLRLDWTLEETASYISSEDPDSVVKETSLHPVASTSQPPLARDSLELHKQQVYKDVKTSPNVVTDSVEVEAEIPNNSCLAGKQQNVSFLFAELAEDDANEHLGREANRETNVVSRQVMEVSASMFAETGHPLEFKAKGVTGLDLGWQSFSATLSELVDEAENQSLHQEDNGEIEVVSKLPVAVSAQSFTGTEPLLETKTNVIQGPLLCEPPLPEIQNGLAELADDQSLHQEDDGEIDVISRHVLNVTSCLFHETGPLLETKNEVIRGPSPAWQPLSESQNILFEQADNKTLREEDDGEADDFSVHVMADSCSFSFPETESLLATTSLNIQDQILGWQPHYQIQSEVKSARDLNLNSGMPGETEETFEKANKSILSMGCEQSEFCSSLSATNAIPSFEQFEVVIEIGSGGGSEEVSSRNRLESHQNKETMGFITATLAAEESANLLQPVEDIFSGITEGKENQIGSHVIRGVMPETEIIKSFPFESAKLSSASNFGSRRGKSAAVLHTRTKRIEGKEKRIGGNCKALLLENEAKSDKSKSTSLHAGSETLEQDIFTHDKENPSPISLILERLKEIGYMEESKSSSLHDRSVKQEPEVLTHNKENLTPSTHILKNRLLEIGDIKESNSLSLHAGLEKLESENFTTDKENLTPNAHFVKRLQETGDIKESKSSLKAISRPLSLKIPSSDQYVSKAVLEPEIFTPDKENLTPNSRMRKRMQEIGKLQGDKDSPMVTRKLFSSEVVCCPDMHSGESIIPVKKQIQSAFGSTSSQSALKHKQVLPTGKTERVPFQPLLEKPLAKSERHTEACNAAARNANSRGSRSSSILSAGRSKMKWTIVVDTSSLLDMGSRKSLQLLQGLKGTQMVIPRTVLRELDERKHTCGLFFRRTNNVVSSALEWIQECMVKTKWWVHLQSSSEETGPTAPTPPASPSLFSDSSAFPFSLHCAALEILSPTPEDNVLECALLHRKRNRDGQLVLLSNDVTLNIKAMAEGIICETAQEFYESLANPFSERFMWAESSPRGQTWSHLDDLALRERYNNRSFQYKKASKGGESNAKGLKLILLHNSHYGFNK